MRQYKTITRREEEANHILMIMQAAEGPLTAQAIAQHPTMPPDTDSRAVSAYLRGLSLKKIVKRNAAREWTVLKPTVPSSSPPSQQTTKQTDMFYVVDTATLTLSLEIKGLRLPVHFE